MIFGGIGQHAVQIKDKRLNVHQGLFLAYGKSEYWGLYSYAGKLPYCEWLSWGYCCNGWR
jgi:hypothetical protein